MSWLLPAAIFGSSLLGAGASLLGSNRQASAAERAANMAAEQYAMMREDIRPQREAGYRALAMLEPQVVTPFQGSPGYQFRFAEGVRAIDRAANARGMLDSGARLRALTAYGQNVAADEYQNYINRLLNLAGFGQQATVQSAAASAPFMNTALQAQMNAGTASGAGLIGAANALQGGINNLLLAGGTAPPGSWLRNLLYGA